MKIISLLIKHIKFYTSIFAYICVNMAIEMLDNDCNFVVSLLSCERIYEDLEPCQHGVSLRFVYDYNMEY